MKVLLTLALLFAAREGMAQGHCSLIVKVVDSNEKEVPEARISVKEQSGRIEESDYRRGGVRFCDLGMLPVTVTVGDVGCAGVVVHNSPLEWGETKTLKVVYDREPCLRHPLPVAACDILLRFVDTQNNWIAGVAFQPPGLPGLESRRSDRYGRILVQVPAGEEFRSAATREGFALEEIRFTCTRDLMKHERVVTLRKIN